MAELDFVYEKIEFFPARRNLAFHEIRKHQWIAIFRILALVERQSDYVVLGDSVFQKIVIEQLEKERGLSGAADSGYHFYLSVPHVIHDFLQIQISFYHFEPRIYDEKLRHLRRKFST